MSLIGWRQVDQQFCRSAVDERRTAGFGAAFCNPLMCKLRIRNANDFRTRAKSSYANHSEYLNAAKCFNQGYFCPPPIVSPRSRVPPPLPPRPSKIRPSQNEPPPGPVAPPPNYSRSIPHAFGPRFQPAECKPCPPCHILGHPYENEANTSPVPAVEIEAPAAPEAPVFEEFEAPKTRYRPDTLQKQPGKYQRPSNQPGFALSQEAVASQRGKLNKTAHISRPPPVKTKSPLEEILAKRAESLRGDSLVAPSHGSPPATAIKLHIPRANSPPASPTASPGRKIHKMPPPPVRHAVSPTTAGHVYDSNNGGSRLRRAVPVSRFSPWITQARIEPSQENIIDLDI